MDHLANTNVHNDHLPDRCKYYTLYREVSIWFQITLVIVANTAVHGVVLDVGLRRKQWLDVVSVCIFQYA